MEADIHGGMIWLIFVGYAIGFAMGASYGKTTQVDRRLGLSRSSRELARQHRKEGR